MHRAYLAVSPHWVPERSKLYSGNICAGADLAVSPCLQWIAEGNRYMDCGEHSGVGLAVSPCSCCLPAGGKPSDGGWCAAAGLDVFPCPDWWPTCLLLFSMMKLERSEIKDITPGDTTSGKISMSFRGNSHVTLT